MGPTVAYIRPVATIPPAAVAAVANPIHIYNLGTRADDTISLATLTVL